METRIIRTLPSDDYSHMLEEAARIISRGGLVAFPTETVYGLGADAMNPEAAARIYAAKGRPSDNPLIVHIADYDQVELAARDIPPAARLIMEHFWPGPLTVILKKGEAIPKETTGGLSTVAVRMPSHPVARDLIRQSGKLIAAPSANLSGRPSPTSAQHVYEDLKGRIPLILDGGPVGIGIESTIIDMTGPVPMILRPGYVSQASLASLIGEVKTDPAVSGRKQTDQMVARAPGMKYRHYAPSGRLILVEGPRDRVVETILSLSAEKIAQGYKVGLITTSETAASYPGRLCLHAGSREDPASIAGSLYRILRECDQRKLDYIYSECFFEEGLGDAIMNRMLKASAYHLISAQDEPLTPGVRTGIHQPGLHGQQTGGSRPCGRRQGSGCSQDDRETIL